MAENAIVESRDNVEFEKYSSLIRILKGQEEFLLDTNGIIISSNLEAVNVSGFEEYEVIGKHIALFYQLEEEGKAMADLEKARRLGQQFVIGLKVKKRGAPFWAKMEIKFIQPTHSTDPCFKVVLQDDTHRALSSFRTRTLKDEYLAIFNNPFIGIFKFRMQDFKVQRCNQKTLDITCKTGVETIYFQNFFRSREQLEHFIAILKNDKKIEGFKFVIDDGRDNDDKWGVLGARYFERQGFVEGIIMDVCEQHNQMLELKRVNSELDSFTYHASHDLRAPLTTIQGLVNLGLKDSRIEEAHSYFRMIQNRVSHMDILLKDLISVSFNSRAKVENIPFDFSSEVPTILKTLECPGDIFHIDFDLQQEHEFATDPVRIRTILRNLLSNALKYRNPERPKSFIKIRILVTERSVAIHIEDNGIGIHHSFKNKIYEMFFRATTQSTGTGLGLFIVKSMVDKLGGQISFESTLNEGTTFLIKIPNQIQNSDHV